ncbi:hypothetical protein DSCW_05520 [Desulfosarcina widdelii]|uniref:Uncharacterized protein n=1 Tax=Desulfosarcina widdelii TaxID=947919 RepID=A0A5K7YXK5_9BACT|nr:hypothetical protein [Desulfosarcina widdelii]BBO73135.1 hypothetical protein DSCW_05520 [Desulfosarcina widdelii]
MGMQSNRDTVFGTKASVDRVEDQGVVDGKCVVCGAQILLTGIGRSIWDDGTSVGSGEVRTVAEAYCPNCDEKPELPDHGTPIFKSEIVRLAAE